MPELDPWITAVNRHGGNEALSIPFIPSIRYLQDLPFCKILGNDLRDMGSNWEIRTATQQLWKQLPEASGLYMFVWRSSNISFLLDQDKQHSFTWCLYIGQAGGGESRNSIKSRYRNEYANYVRSDPESCWAQRLSNDRKTRLKLLLSLTPIEFWYIQIDDRSKIENLESRLIRTFRPPGNSAGKSTLKPLAPVQAFRSY